VPTRQYQHIVLPSSWIAPTGVISINIINIIQSRLQPERNTDPSDAIYERSKPSNNASKRLYTGLKHELPAANSSMPQTSTCATAVIGAQRNGIDRSIQWQRRQLHPWYFNYFKSLSESCLDSIMLTLCPYTTKINAVSLLEGGRVGQHQTESMLIPWRVW